MTAWPNQSLERRRTAVRSCPLNAGVSVLNAVFFLALVLVTVVSCSEPRGNAPQSSVTSRVTDPAELALVTRLANTSFLQVPDKRHAQAGQVDQLLLRAAAAFASHEPLAMRAVCYSYEGDSIPQYLIIGPDSSVGVMDTRADRLGPRSLWMGRIDSMFIVDGRSGSRVPVIDLPITTRAQGICLLFVLRGGRSMVFGV